MRRIDAIVDWTPGNTFAKGDNANYGFHALAFDSDDVDDYLDIFLGSKWEEDYFFENTGGLQIDEAAAHGQFTPILDQDPISMKGTFSADPQTDVCLTDPSEFFITTSAKIVTVSVVFNPPASCTETTLFVERQLDTEWTELLPEVASSGEEIAAQFDDVGADQLRFTMTGVGCDSSDPYYLEVLARTDNP